MPKRLDRVRVSSSQGAASMEASLAMPYIKQDYHHCCLISGAPYPNYA